MVNLRQPRDVAQILLSVLFLAIMIIACLWIVRPFVLGFAWAATVVVAVGATLLLARTRFAWLAASAATILALPRLLVFDMTNLLAAFAQTRDSVAWPHQRSDRAS